LVQFVISNVGKPWKIDEILKYLYDMYNLQVKQIKNKKILSRLWIIKRFYWEIIGKQYKYIQNITFGNLDPFKIYLYLSKYSL